jgi:hypothetical protein
VALGAPILDALGHGVRFLPDDVLPQVPAIVTKGERDHPGDADEILLLQPLRFKAEVRLASWLMPVPGVHGLKGCAGRVPLIAVVCVAQDEPKRPVIFQHPTYLLEHFEQVPDVLFRRVLDANLLIDADGPAFRAFLSRPPENVAAGNPIVVFSVNVGIRDANVVAFRVSTNPPCCPVIPKAKIGRTGHAAVNTFVWQPFQHIQAVAEIDCIQIQIHVKTMWVL